MALTRLSCPECGKVLKPAKPVSAGKKVKCPECETVFVVREEEETEAVEEERPRKSSRKAEKGGSRKPAVKEAPKKEEKKEEEETYGYVKDPDEDDDSKKVKVDWTAQTKQKDLRGPAIVALTKPASWLQLIGLIGTIGWLVLIFLILIPVVFPVKDDTLKPVMAIPRGLGTVNPQAGGTTIPRIKPPGGGEAAPVPSEDVKFDEEKPPFGDVHGLDLAENFAWTLPLMILGAVFSAVVTAGAIKMQTLESREFGLTSSIMVLFPIHFLGTAGAVTILIQFLLGMVLDDRDYTNMLTLTLSGKMYVLCVAIGAWCILTLMNEKVKAGFEYEPE